MGQLFPSSTLSLPFSSSSSHLRRTSPSTQIMDGMPFVLPPPTPPPPPPPLHGSHTNMLRGVIITGSVVVGAGVLAAFLCHKLKLESWLEKRMAALEGSSSEDPASPPRTPPPAPPSSPPSPPSSPYSPPLPPPPPPPLTPPPTPPHDIEAAVGGDTNQGQAPPLTPPPTPPHDIEAAVGGDTNQGRLALFLLAFADAGAVTKAALLAIARRLWDYLGDGGD